MSNESKCPGHNRAECVSCCWPRRDTDSQWTPAERSALGEMNSAPLEFNKIATGYTAVDMTTAAAQGFRDGAASVSVTLPAFDGYKDFVVRELQAAFTAACESRGIKVVSE